MLLRPPLQNPFSRDGSLYVLIFYKLIPSDIDKHVCSLLINIFFLNKSLILPTPNVVLILATLEAEGRLFRGKTDKAVVEFNPMRTINVR